MPACLAALAAAVVAGIAWWSNRNVRGFLPDDLPRPGRKQHLRPIPLAGIALLPALLPWLVSARHWWLGAGVAAVGAVGFVDDWYKEKGRDFDWRIKAVVLLLAAGAVVLPGHDPAAEPLAFAAAVLLVFVLTNAANFLDNTDGVAAALSGTGLLLATGGDGPLAAAGFAALGFLPWNWPRPVLFLGDAGAYVLGLCVGAVVVDRSPPLWPALLPFVVLIADFVQVVTARIVLGLRPWVGDRRHLTHVLQNLGLPRMLVAPVLAALAVGLWLLAA